MHGGDMEPLLRIDGDTDENIPCSKKKIFLLNLVTAILIIGPLLFTIFYFRYRF